MTMQSLHIVFTDSGARMLTRMLRDAGRPDEVIHLPDDLSVGPISPPDPVSRDEWVRQEFAIEAEEWSWPLEDVNRFWERALSRSRRRVVWVSRLSAWEYSGFVEFVRRAESGPYEVVDLTDAGSGGGRTRKYLPRVGVADFYDQPTLILDSLVNARSLTPAENAAYRGLWKRLCAENSPLRTVTEDGLVSVPLSYFDALLLSCTVEQWRKTARVLGEAFIKSWESGFCQISEIVLAARIRALAAAGRVESKGNLFRIRHSEIRLPASGEATVAPQLSSSVSQ